MDSRGGWTMIPAPKVNADGPAISQPGFKSRDWMSATVPGTVLTTMIDRGIYPDPDYGLNNLAIPESLNKQDYWYRVEFHLPKAARGRRLTLTFEGINYRQPCGSMASRSARSREHSSAASLT